MRDHSEIFVSFAIFVVHTGRRWEELKTVFVLTGWDCPDRKPGSLLPIGLLLYTYGNFASLSAMCLNWFKRKENALALAVALTVLILHLVIINQVDSQILDEAHYIPEANAILVGEELDNPEHPPVGKLFLALSIKMFGDDTVFHAVRGTAWNDVFAVGTCGRILHYDGSSWHGMSSHTSQDLYATWSVASDDAFAAGSNGTMLHFDGSAWDTMPTPSAEDVHGIWGDSAANVYAVGTGGTILHFDGTAWRQIESPTSAELRAIWGTNGGADVFAVGQGGVIVRYDGLRWNPMEAPTQDDIFGVWGTSESDVWAVGSGGIILHFDGASWSTKRQGKAETLFDIWGTSSDNVFAVGTAGTSLHYTGSAWVTMERETPRQLNGVWGQSTRAYAAGKGGVIQEYGGSSWDPRHNPTFAWRIFPILFGTASIILFYLICQSLTTQRWLPLIATSLFAFENQNFIQSHVAMLDVFGVTLMMASFLLYLRSHYASTGAMLAASTLAKLTGVLAVVPIGFHWIITRWQPNRQSVIDGLKLVVIAPVAFFVLMPLLDYVAMREWHCPWDRVMEMRDLLSGLTFSSVNHEALSHPWEWLISWEPMWFWYDPAYQSSPSWTVWALTIPAMAFAIWGIVRRSSLCLFAVLWFTSTYLSLIAIDLITDRVMFKFYFYPTIGAICLALGYAIHWTWTASSERESRVIRWAIRTPILAFFAAHAVIFAVMSPYTNLVTGP